MVGRIHPLKYKTTIVIMYYKRFGVLYWAHLTSFHHNKSSKL